MNLRMCEDDDQVATAFLVSNLHPISDPLPDNEHIPESRSFTQSLVECSELEDDILLRTVCCNDWKEAAVGWRQTVPCVKYAWSEEPRKGLAGGHEGGKKQKPKDTKLKILPKEFDWRSTFEPGTYRYSPGGIHRKNNEHDISSPTPSNAINDILLQLRRVRDHFEKTLKSANKPAKLPRRKSQSEELCDPQKSISEGALRELGYNEDSLRRKSREGNLDQSTSADSLRRMPSHHPHHLRQMWQQYQVQKVEINSPFVDNVRSHTPGCTHHLKLTHARRSPLEHHYLHKQYSSEDAHTHSSLTGWGDLAGLVVEAEPLLNPLKKVTPKQRRVHDDSEATELHPTNSFRPASSKVVSPDAEPPLTSLTGCVLPEEEDMLPTERFEQLCVKVNSGRNQPSIPSKCSRAEFSLAKELQSVQDILQAQKYLSKQVEKKPGSQRCKPHRLRRLPPQSSSAYDLHHGKGDLGEPLHRGIIDRKTASDLAAELMPGISGQKLEPPLYAYRII